MSDTEPFKALLEVRTQIVYTRYPKGKFFTQNINYYTRTWNLLITLFYLSLSVSLSVCLSVSLCFYFSLSLTPSLSLSVSLSLPLCLAIPQGPLGRGTVTVPCVVLRGILSWHAQHQWQGARVLRGDSPLAPTMALPSACGTPVYSRGSKKTLVHLFTPSTPMPQSSFVYSAYYAAPRPPPTQSNQPPNNLIFARPHPN